MYVFQNTHDGMIAFTIYDAAGTGGSVGAVRQDTSCCDLRRSEPGFRVVLK